jgi:hypothetical protein
LVDSVDEGSLPEKVFVLELGLNNNLNFSLGFTTFVAFESLLLSIVFVNSFYPSKSAELSAKHFFASFMI